MINFPNSPSQGQVFTSTTGLKYVYLDGVWRIVEAPQDIGKAEARNRIVNGAMQISQENGNTLVAGLQYAADQWRIVGGGTAGISSQRVQVVTPNGSVNRIRYTITVADTSLTAGEFLMISQYVEGVRVADFRWGSASARQLVLRFGWKSPAGTYTVALRNEPATRSFLAAFTISAGQANTDTEQVIVIPGDTAGTWLTSTGVGLVLNICLATNPAGYGVAGWQAGDFIGVATQTNGVASTSNVYELFDVGLYLDPLNTGIAPPWQMPDEAEELRACMRYYEKADFTLAQNSSPTTYMLSGFWKATKRITPAMTFTAGSGSGASFLGSGLSGFYQNAAHSQVWGAVVTGNARM